MPTERAAARTLEAAEGIAEISPLATRMIKAGILMRFEKPLDETSSLENKLIRWRSENHGEGIAAFVEKRKPRFTGR